MKRPTSFSFLLALALPFAGLAIPSTAMAQPPRAAAAAEAQKVAIDGRFQRFVISPRGQVTAILLQDGTVVHVAGRDGAGPISALRPGDVVHVEGNMLRTPSGGFIVRAVVSQNGKVIADGSHGRKGERGHQRGEGGHRGEGKLKLSPQTASARIATVVVNPKGHTSALLLDDGTTATGFGLDGLGLKAGDRVTVNGKGGAYPLGKALRVETITLPNGETRALPQPQHGRHARRQRQQQPV